MLNSSAVGFQHKLIPSVSIDARINPKSCPRWSFLFCGATYVCFRSAIHTC